MSPCQGHIYIVIFILLYSDNLEGTIKRHAKTQFFQSNNSNELKYKLKCEEPNPETHQIVIKSDTKVNKYAN